MPQTKNRVSSFYEASLRVPDLLNFNTDVAESQNIQENLKNLDQDLRSLEFSSPLFQPLTPSLLQVVHSAGSPDEGGFFGDTRNHGTKAHRGIDIQADLNTPVLAAEDGVVVRSEFSKTYGHVVYINHRHGYQTRYAHLNALEVKPGMIITKGELLGYSGKTGNAHDPAVLPHLHFEIRRIKDHTSPQAIPNEESKALDPLPFLLKNRFQFDAPIDLNALGSSVIKA